MTSLIVLALAGSMWSQSTSDTSAPSASASEAVSASEPAPAADAAQSDAKSDSVTTPPTEPSRSYVLIGLHFSEGSESDPSGMIGYYDQVSSVTHLFGSLRLLKIKRHSETGLDYMGGGSLYSDYGNFGTFGQQSQKLTADQSFHWGRQRLIFRDWFDYVGEGNLGSASFGGPAAYGVRFSDVGPNASANSFDSSATVSIPVGQQNYTFNSTYITNVSQASFQDVLTARSSLAASGSYAFTNYLGNAEDLFNNRQISGSLAYTYDITQKNRLGVTYNYQTFRFPDSAIGSLQTHSAQLTFRHSVSGRMELDFGFGPEFINLGGVGGNGERQFNAGGRALLHYRWERSGITISYNRAVTAGSGFFAGANTDVISAAYDRTFRRAWRTTVSGGFARSSDIGSVSAAYGSSFSYSFAGLAVQRRLSRSLGVFGSYQYDDENLGGCSVSSGCNPQIRRHIALVGLDVYFHPLRLE